MKRLLSMEFKRAIISSLLWTAVCILIMLNIYRMVLNSYGFTITASSFLFYNTPIICMFLAIFIPLHIGQEFEVRTINNKIIAGYSRKQIYITEMIISIICSCFLLFIDICSIIVLAAIVKLPYGIASADLFINGIICMICIAVIAAFFTMITMIMHKQLKSIALALGVTILCLQLGGNTVSALNQEAYHVEEDGTVVENVLYIDGFKRAMANGHILFSPFAQVKYHPYMYHETVDMKAKNSLILKNISYHWEFSVMNFIEMFIFTKAGLFIFRKQDLK